MQLAGMDKKTIGLKIRKKRLQLGLVQKDIADAIGVKASYITRIENGDANFTIDKLFDISKVLKIPEYELLSEKPLILFEEKDPILSFNQPEADYVAIPQFKNAESLKPEYDLSEEVPIDYVPIHKSMLPGDYNKDPLRIVAVSVKNALMQPTITDGSILWIDRMDTKPSEDQIYVFLLPNSSITIKRLIKMDRHFCIIGIDQSNGHPHPGNLNERFPMVLECKESEGKPWPIRGRVIWIMNRQLERRKKPRK